MFDIMFGVYIFLTGLAIGSFANVCIYRIPEDKSIVSPGSKCPSCDTAIKARHNIPILSFLFLGGKCAYCQTRISWRYPMIELLCGLLYMLAFYEFWLKGHDYQNMLVAIYLSTVFLIIFFIDLDHKIIPDSLSLSGIPIGVAVSFIPAVEMGWLDSIIGLFAGGLLFLAVAEIGDRVFKKESMGGGDIKLAAMLGAFLGWKGILLVLVFASFLGAVIGGAFLIAAKDKEKARTIPFGPFLVAAALIVFYRGPEILSAYLEFVGK